MRPHVVFVIGEEESTIPIVNDVAHNLRFGVVHVDGKFLSGQDKCLALAHEIDELCRFGYRRILVTGFMERGSDFDDFQKFLRVDVNDELYIMMNTSSNEKCKMFQNLRRLFLVKGKAAELFNENVSVKGVMDLLYTHTILFDQTRPLPPLQSLNPEAGMRVNMTTGRLDASCLTLLPNSPRHPSTKWNRTVEDEQNFGYIRYVNHFDRTILKTVA